MNVTGAHVAGGSLGAIAGVALAAAAHKLGLGLTDAEAAGLGISLLGVGGGVGHMFSKAWGNPGVFPALYRGFFGAPKKLKS